MVLQVNTSNYSNLSCFRKEWLLNSRSHIVYECKQDKQVSYVLPVEYILGKLSVVIQERNEGITLPDNLFSTDNIRSSKYI